MGNITTAPATLFQDHFQDVLDSYLENNLLAGGLFEDVTLPANQGHTVDFHRLVTFAKQTIGLSGGLVPGAGEQFGSAHPLIHATAGQLKNRSYTIDSVSAQLTLVGNDLNLSELSIISSKPNPVPALSRAFLYNASDTLDQMYVNWLVCNTVDGSTNTGTVPSATIGGASVSVAVTWGDGSATLTEATLDADIPSHRIAAETFNTAEATLRAGSAKPRSGALFDALISPQLAGDLRIDGTFQDIALKGQNRGENKFERATIGEVFGCRVMVSENVIVRGASGTIDAANDTIVRCPVVGAGYAKRISHASGVGRPSVRFIAPSPSAADVYGLNGFLMWKVYKAAVVLQPLAGNIIKCATTRPRNIVQADDSGEWG